MLPANPQPELCSAAWTSGVHGQSHLAAMCVVCLGLCSSDRMPAGSRILFQPLSSSCFTEEPGANTVGSRQVSVTFCPGFHPCSTQDPPLQPAWSPLCFSNTPWVLFCFVFPTALYLHTEDWPSSDERDRLTEGLGYVGARARAAAHVPLSTTGHPSHPLLPHFPWGSELPWPCTESHRQVQIPALLRQTT